MNNKINFHIVFAGIVAAIAIVLTGFAVEIAKDPFMTHDATAFVYYPNYLWAIGAIVSLGLFATFGWRVAHYYARMLVLIAMVVALIVNSFIAELLDKWWGIPGFADAALVIIMVIYTIKKSRPAAHWVGR